MWLRLLHRIEFASLVWLTSLVVLRMADVVPSEGRLDIILMPRFGHFFVIGMMIHRITADRATLLTWLTLACAIAYSGFGRTDFAPVPSAVYLPVTLAFTILVLVAVKKRTTLTARPLVALGAISYPLYLFHQLAEKTVRSHGLSRWPGSRRRDNRACACHCAGNGRAFLG
jgi:peptidoglycan/LPS O-acetylase OafA/YrhL